MPKEPERLRIDRARNAWLWVYGLSVTMCLFSIVLFILDPTWAGFGVALFWGLPGAGGVVWGAGGSLSWVSLTPENLVIRNALRSHTYPWSQIESFEVFPRSPSGKATTQAVVKLTNGRKVALSCTALPFGWVWNGDKRWATVSDFVQQLTAARETQGVGAR